MSPHADLEVRRAYLRAYKRAHRDRWKEQEADYSRARHANRRAAAYGAPGTITIEDVQAVMAGGCCHYCGGTALLGIDHVRPLHDGGPNTRENLVCCCRACNASKWRQDRPGRWSRHHDRCVGCGTTAARHVARGFCNACYHRHCRGRR